MSENPQTTQVARRGESCRSCGAPLAGDQRYCLGCGERSSDTRIDYLRYLTSPAAPPADPAAAQPVSTAAAPPARAQRDYAPLAAAGGIVVLGIMLLVGVLIGRSGDEPTAAVPPQVVTVTGETTSTEPTTTSTEAEPATTEPAEPTEEGTVAPGGVTEEPGAQPEHKGDNSTPSGSANADEVPERIPEIPGVSSPDAPGTPGSDSAAAEAK